MKKLFLLTLVLFYVGSAQAIFRDRYNDDEDRPGLLGGVVDTAKNVAEDVSEGAANVVEDVTHGRRYHRGHRVYTDTKGNEYYMRHGRRKYL